MGSVVVLPQPDGPSREKNSPSAMIRSTRSTAVTTPRRDWNRFAMPTSSMAGTPELSDVSADVSVRGSAWAGVFTTSMYLPQTGGMVEADTYTGPAAIQGIPLLQGRFST